MWCGVTVSWLSGVYCWSGHLIISYIPSYFKLHLTDSFSHCKVATNDGLIKMWNEEKLEAPCLERMKILLMLWMCIRQRKMNRGIFTHNVHTHTNCSYCMQCVLSPVVHLWFPGNVQGNYTRRLKVIGKQHWWKDDDVCTLTPHHKCI